MVFLPRSNSGVLGILGYPHLAVWGYIKERPFMVFLSWWGVVGENGAKCFDGFFDRPVWGISGYARYPDFACFGCSHPPEFFV